MNQSPIAPHGGTLVDRFIADGERAAAQERSVTLPSLTLSARNLADLRCLASGIYSPLEGFVTEAEYQSILENMRLTSGLAWSIPITLQVTEAQADVIRAGSEVALSTAEGRTVALLKVTDVYRPDQAREAELVYRTTDNAHPGVQAMRAAGPVYLGGPVTVIDELPAEEFPELGMTPRQARQAFAEQGWQTVVAFQTRNPIHRAHEYLTKTALEMVDGLFINPLVGTTKGDDVPAAVRVKCYQVMMEHYYPTERVILGTYPAAMRYAGPREAVLHAISRQNYGCTHFIVGRDHAGVGSYYGSYDAQTIFNDLSAAELQIAILKFEHAFYCKKSNQMATTKTTVSGPEDRVILSGTKVREMLSRGELPPEEFSR
ncbi:MAG: sulfate adenylyltransferase, partial [Trueperaceae bacterium]